MSKYFKWDVFLSHSSHNKDVVREIANRLKSDGVKVWFDEWEIEPGDNIPVKIEDGLENSRVLLLFMSAEAFSSDWSQLESHTYRYRDPLNKERRFIPIRLDDSDIRGSLNQFRYIDWRDADKHSEIYQQLLAACNLEKEEPASAPQNEADEIEQKTISLGHTSFVRSVAISQDGTRALSGSDDGTVRLLDLETGNFLKVMEGHTDSVRSVAISQNGTRALSGSDDCTLRLWDLETGNLLKVVEGHTHNVKSVAISNDATRALSGSSDKTVRLWDLETGNTLKVMEGHTQSVRSIAISQNGTRALSGSSDKTLRLWDLETGNTLKVMEGHISYVWSVAISNDATRALSGSSDKTLRLWDLETGNTLKVMDGHTNYVWSVAISNDATLALSGSSDKTVRLWDLETGKSLKVMEGHTNYVWSVAISNNATRALSGSSDKTVRLWDLETGKSLKVTEGHTDSVWSVAISYDATRAISGSSDKTLRLWDLETGNSLKVMEGHTYSVRSVAISYDATRALSGADDGTVRLWDLETGNSLKVMEGHTYCVWSVAISYDATRALSGADDGTVRLWDLETGNSLKVMEGHTYSVRSVAISYDATRALSGADDGTVRLWDLETGNSLKVMEEHTDSVRSVAISYDAIRALSGADDGTVRLWDLETGNSLKVMEGHTDSVRSVAISYDATRALSGADDGTVRLWDLETGNSLKVMEEHTDSVRSVAICYEQHTFFSSAVNGVLRVWSASNLELSSGDEASKNSIYTNAKVLLVGDTHAGKTGLSNRLAHNQFEKTDSTVGAWATHWKLPVQSEDGVDREVWLWDFGGQADQRLIHQLYMDQTNVAALVFDPQRNDLLDSLHTWNRDLSRAATGDFKKLLVAGRVDAGGLRIGRGRLDEFAKENNFAKYIETSAKEGTGCDELRESICELVDWDRIAKRSSPKLFKQLKEEIVALKDEERILMRFNELRDALTLRMTGVRFTDEELKAVISLLAGPGVVWELGFGSFVLLSPELINAYAQAVIQTIQQDDRELGCIVEEDVLAGKLKFPKELKRLEEDEERIILLAMHRLLVENNLCLNEPTETGTLLVFPSYARRERPELIEHPSVMVSYQFDGFLDDIYATLVVRLHRTSPFKTKNLWNGAADFENETKHKLGVKLSRKAAGKAELLIYFDPELPVGERMMFSKYVEEHLFRKVKDRDRVKRLRHWVCEQCGDPVANRERAMQRLNDNGAEAKIICVNCEKYVQLWDEMEAAFADPEIMRRVRELEKEDEIELDNESKERLLVGEVVSTVALAKQISREFAVSDHGIDMEIEFKTDDGEATGKRLYLQLKSGDSFLNERKRDDAEIFKISKQRHAKYWMDQEYPVMLVIRNSEGEIRWMEVRDYLKEVTENGTKQVRQIVFEGERFDVMSVRRWRDKLLCEEN